MGVVELGDEEFSRFFFISSISSAFCGLILGKIAHLFYSDFQINEPHFAQVSRKEAKKQRRKVRNRLIYNLGCSLHETCCNWLDDELEPFTFKI
ncbi:hypothetical protein [Trichormus sp. NMC-1]|uniref:hypothetical protein n=1 Tax=Trichormus sp. NMC-1 TaxID=1853259 RepID=UPI0008DBF71F|nr:hypothetical protein [Trichormus sp. NMC-1]